MSRRWWGLGALVWGIISILGCSIGGGSGEEEDEDPGTITIGPGAGGETQVTTEDGRTWPPSGPGCEALVACCNDTGASDVLLFCQLTMATETDCSAARTQTAQYIRERNMTVPASCQ